MRRDRFDPPGLADECPACGFAAELPCSTCGHWPHEPCLSTSYDDLKALGLSWPAAASARAIERLGLILVSPLALAALCWWAHKRRGKGLW